MIIRARERSTRRAKRSQPSPAGTTFAPRWQSAAEPVLAVDRDEPPEPAPRDVLEEDALDRLACAEREDLLEPRFEELSHRSRR